MPERLHVEYRDGNGVLVNPLRPRFSIFSPSGAVVLNSAEATFEATGIYYYTFSISTAYSTERGIYQLWPEGYINGALITVDEPIYFSVEDTPTISSSAYPGRSFVNQIRNAIGDNDPTQYMIHPLQLNYYVQDGVRNSNSSYNFGYTVKVSTAGNDKSERIVFLYGTAEAYLSDPARTWYAINTIKDIMESQIRINMFGSGIVNAGDIKVNVAAGMREQVNYLKSLKEDIKMLKKDLSLNGTSGYCINNYQIADLWVSESS
jgi:hypothetical protein